MNALKPVMIKKISYDVNSIKEYLDLITSSLDDYEIDELKLKVMDLQTIVNSLLITIGMATMSEIYYKASNND